VADMHLGHGAMPAVMMLSDIGEYAIRVDPFPDGPWPA